MTTTHASLSRVAALRGLKRSTVFKYMPPPARSTTSTLANTSKWKKCERSTAKRLFLVKWEGYPESENSWMPEGSLLRDGCKESIDAFWLKSPAEEFYPDAEHRPRCWMCGYACKNPATRFLKAHIKSGAQMEQTSH